MRARSSAPSSPRRVVHALRPAADDQDIGVGGPGRGDDLADRVGPLEQDRLGIDAFDQRLALGVSQPEATGLEVVG